MVLIVSFVALAVLWPEPKLTGDRWRPLPGPLGRVLGSRPVEIACGAIGVVLLALVIVAGLAGTQSPFDNFAPSFVFIIFWVGLVFVSALFGNVFAGFSPWRALGRATAGSHTRARRAAAAPPALSRAARALARGGRAAGLHLDRARLRVGRGAADAGHRGARLHARDARGPGRLRGRDLDAPRRGVRRVLRPVLAHLSVRAARPRGGPAPAAGGPAAARRGAGNGRARARDDRHRHVRRPQPGPALERPDRRRGDRHAPAGGHARAGGWASRS